MKVLAELKTHLEIHLPMLSADKCHILIKNGNYADGYLEYTVQLLLLDYRSDPIKVLVEVKSWLKKKHRHLKKDQVTEIDLSFSSEVIDLETFDLEVIFDQRDKINITEDGYQECKNVIFSDEKNDWITV